MSEHRACLDAAAFLDSRRGMAITGATTAQARSIAQHFLAACYDDLGKVPRLLDGEDVAQLLQEILPRHFGVRDPLAAVTEPVLDAYFAFLHETQMVPNAFEQRQALATHAAAFRAAVAAGVAHRDGVAVTGPGRTVAHRADKVGRNDPCPCGSGKKFKKCCMGLGGQG